MSYFFPIAPLKIYAKRYAEKQTANDALVCSPISVDDTRISLFPVRKQRLYYDCILFLRIFKHTISLLLISHRYACCFYVQYSYYHETVEIACTEIYRQSSFFHVCQMRHFSRN